MGVCGSIYTFLVKFCFKLQCDIWFSYPQFNRKCNFFIQIFLPVFVLEKNVTFAVKSRLHGTIYTFKTLSNADKIPRFCSYIPLAYNRESPNRFIYVMSFWRKTRQSKEGTIRTFWSSLAPLTHINSINNGILSAVLCHEKNHRAKFLVILKAPDLLF